MLVSELVLIDAPAAWLELIGLAFFIYGLMVLVLEVLGWIVTRVEHWWERRHPE